MPRNPKRKMESAEKVANTYLSHITSRGTVDVGSIAKRITADRRALLARALRPFPVKGLAKAYWRSVNAELCKRFTAMLKEIGE